MASTASQAILALGVLVLLEVLPGCQRPPLAQLARLRLVFQALVQMLVQLRKVSKRSGERIRANTTITGVVRE